MHTSCKGDVCAGWLGGSSHGKVESGFLFVSRVQTRGKGKSQSGTFLFAQSTELSSHTPHVKSITKQRVRH